MKHDTYPLPRIDVHLDLAQGTFWSQMDLLKGFYQLPMHEDSVKYTAFNTLAGKFEFLVVPMGLQNSPGSFMRAMNKVFEGLLWDPNSRQECGILVYLDDILVFSKTEDQHMEILKSVLDRLRKHKIQCRFSQCTFAVTEVEYLGFRLSAKGVRMDPKKVEIIKQWPESPSSKSDIRGFLGLVNYLKRFCKGLSHHSAILSSWASENSKEDWTEKHVMAMKEIKNLLCSDQVLAAPKIDPATDNYYPFIVITDASEIAAGAILLQQQGPSVEDTKVVAYASSKFKQAEKNYSVHEKELLGVLLAVQQWNCFLEGSKFTVYTDHQSLIWLNKLQNPSRRQSRWVDILQGHSFEVVYIKGENNPADAFTRIPWQGIVDEEEEPIKEPLIVLRTLRTALQQANVHIKVTAAKLAEWKQDTIELLAKGMKLPPLYTSIIEGYSADPNFSNLDWINMNHLQYRHGLWYKDGKVAVPNILGIKVDILVEHHDSLLGGHLGVHKTHEKIARLFWWQYLATDVDNHVRTCPACQVSKYRNWKPQGRTGDIRLAKHPWEVVHVDFAGPFKCVSPGGYNRVVVFTDEFTKLSVFVKCKTTLTSDSLADLYIQHIWKVYGRPGRLVSDNEPILCAEAWMKIHEKLGTNMKHVAAYNAKANGAAEVMVKQLKSLLSCFERQGIKWWRALPAVERAYNDSVHSVTGYTPFYMNFGRHPLPDLNSLLEPEVDNLIQTFIHAVQAELAKVHSDVAEKMLQHSIRETAKRNAMRSPTIEYKVGDYVYLETSAIRKTPALSPLRSGPYKVMQVMSNGNTVLLEGFRHPFSVELISPTYAYLGASPHLTKHLIDESSIGPNVDATVGNTGNHDVVSQGLTGVTDSSAGATGVFPADDGRVDLTHDTGAHVTLEVDVPDSEVEIVESLGLGSQEQEAIQDYLDDSEDVWEFQPVARVGPSTVQLKSSNSDIRRLPAIDDEVAILASGNKPAQEQPVQVVKVDEDILATAHMDTGEDIGGSRASRKAEQLALADFNSAPASTSDITMIDSLVCLPAQLPVSQIRILDIQSKSGSRSSSIIIFTGETNEKYSIRYRHLAGILGPVEFQKLLRKFEEKNQ